MSSQYEKLLNKLTRKESEVEVPRQQQPRDNFVNIRTQFISKPGVYRFRILPNRKDPTGEFPFHKYRLHTGIINPNFGGKRSPIVCPGYALCKACKEADIEKKNDPQNGWKYGAKDNILYYVILINEKGDEELVKLSLNPYQHEQVENKIIANLKSGIAIMDIQEGMWLELTYTITQDGQKKRYKTTVAVDPKPESVDPELRALFNKQLTLDKIYDNVTYSPEDIAKLLKGERTTPVKALRENNNSARSSESKAKSAPPQMKFASDEVEEMGGEEVDNVESNFLPDEEEPPANNNMRRLASIMDEEE